MQINNSYIIDHSRVPVPHADLAATSRGGKQQRIRQAQDSYNRSSSSAQIIEAEYVDLYDPEKVVVRQEQQNPAAALKSASISYPATTDSSPIENPVAEKYQLGNIDTPPPGTYINYFA